MVKSKKVIAITGASGYVGRNLIKFCIQNNVHVKAYCRDINKLKHFNSNLLTVYKYKLGESLNHVSNVNTLIHLAHQRFTGARNRNKEDINKVGAIKILEDVKKYKIKNVLYLSSIIAHDKTLSEYGKSKFNCENLFRKFNHNIIKVSMVFGGEPYGFYHKLLNDISNIKFMPIIFPNMPIDPVHIEDLCKFIIKNIFAELRYESIILFKSKRKITTKIFFILLAKKLFKKDIICLNLPSKLILQFFFVLSFFNGFFNKIFERVAGLASHEINYKKNIIRINEKDLKITNAFFYNIK